MSMNVPLTLAQLPPAATATVGGALLRLKAVRDALKEESGDDACDACQKAVAALTACVQFAREVESDARGYFQGWAGIAENAKDKDVAAAGAAALKQARTAKQKEADALADDAVTAMTTAKKTIDAEVLRATGPRALRNSKSIADDMHTCAGISLEEDTKLPSTWCDHYDGLIESGEDDTADLFELAVKPLAIAVIGMSYSDLRKKVGPMLTFNGAPIGGNAPETPERRQVVEKQRQAAMQFLNAIQERARNRMPEPLKLAVQAYVELTGCFLPLLGYHALVVDGPTYSARFKSGRPRSPLDTAEDWAERLGVAAQAAAPMTKQAGKR